jgi:outer membrane protein TolC
MNHWSCTKLRFWLVAFAAVVMLCLFGCAEHNYKAEADKKVYDIIDRKWQPQFGPKVNYKISDVPPSPDDIQAERTAPASGILTLPQAVAIAVAHNREYQMQRELLYTSALDLRLTRHEFENNFSGGINGGYARDRNDEEWGLETTWGFNRLFASGTKISTKVGVAWAKVLTGNLEGGLASILGMTVTQPLFRGSDPKVVLEPLTQAERDTLYQIRLFSRFRKKTVVLVISQYYQVLQLHDKVESAKDHYEKLVLLLEQAGKLAEAGRLPKYEVEEIEQRKLNAWDNYAQAEKEYGMMFDLLKITLGLPTTAEFKLDQTELEALKAEEPKYPDFSEKDVIETALFRRLDLANSADAVIDAQRQVYVAADALRADASITGSIDTISRGGSRQTLKAKENYNVDVELNLPIDRVAEQNLYRKALIELNAKQREYELLVDTVAMEVRQAHRELVEAAERYKVHSEGLKVAQKRFKDTLTLMKYGRASSRRVVSALNDLRDARDGTAEALVNYTLATLKFYRDTEILQVRPDGMWEKDGSSVASNSLQVGMFGPKK